MVVVFPLIFVANKKIIYGYNFVAHLTLKLRYIRYSANFPIVTILKAWSYNYMLKGNKLQIYKHANYLTKGSSYIFCKNFSWECIQDSVKHL